MTTQSINGVTYWLPENPADVISLVNDAAANNEVICMRGAAHSFPIIGILEKGPVTGKQYKYVMLAKMYSVAITGDVVKAQAGCHLGYDPWDPTGTSTLENSLLYQLNNLGLALPDLGGITHQTVGGFLSTASSGGSLKYSFEESLLSIDIVTCPDGKNATLQTFTRPVDENFDDPFYGVGIASIGLFGIIVSATFKCISNFYIAGQEATTYATDCAVDLFGAGTGDKPSLETFFNQTDYTRLMWWPQEHVQKMVVWQASRTNAEGARLQAEKGYKAQTTPTAPQPCPPYPALKPYQEVPYIFGSPTLATLGADVLFTAIGQWPNWLLDLLGDTTEYKLIKDTVDALFFPVILPKLLDIFVTLDNAPGNNNNGPQIFSDIWYTGLPMDNQMSDKLMPVWFTELWIDVRQTQNVMTDLLNFYNEDTANTMAFSCEIYAAKANQFWLSPAYNLDVIRIDVFWFANTAGNSVDFYQKFWTLLSKYNYRPHWAKYLPAGDSAQGVDYLKSNYPKWNNWMKLREQLDPGQVFVNDYWREHLGIAPVTPH